MSFRADVNTNRVFDDSLGLELNVKHFREYDEFTIWKADQCVIFFYADVSVEEKYEPFRREKGRLYVSHIHWKVTGHRAIDYRFSRELDEIIAQALCAYEYHWGNHGFFKDEVVHAHVAVSFSKPSVEVR